MEIACLNAVGDRRTQVVERYPAPILLPGSNLAADAQLERKQHLRQCSSPLAQNQPCPQMHNTNTASRRGIGCCFPLPADIGEKSVPGGTVFSQHFAATIAIVSNRGSTDDHLWRFFNSCNSFRNQP